MKPVLKMVIPIQYKISERTKILKSLFLNVLPKLLKALSLTGGLSSNSFYLIKKAGSNIQTRAIKAKNSRTNLAHR